MKILYTVLIWCLIQLFASKTWAASDDPNAATSAKDKLVLFYENELQLLAKETNEKAKVLSGKLLQDPKIQQATSTIIREFKKNITEYLDNYEFYRRHELDNVLLSKFITSTIHYYLQEPSPNSDSQYIVQLLKKLQYDELCDEYEGKFQKLIKQKFLPKFEELKTQLLSNNSKQTKALLDWYNDLKQCRDYKCHYNYLNKFTSIIISPKDQLLQYIEEQIENIDIYYTNTALNISKAALKDPTFSQLIPGMKQLLAKDINEFIRRCESNRDVKYLNDLMQFFHDNITKKYYYNTRISPRDRQLLQKIFNNQNLKQFEAEYQLKFNKFIEDGLRGKFQQLKASLSQNELLQWKPLLQWFENLLNVSSYAERVNEFVKLSDLI